MNAEDFSRLSYLLRVLPAPETHCDRFPIFGNLFIVATHASPSISNSQIDSILQIGATRLYSHISSTIIAERSERINRSITQEDFQKRFFAFWEETPQRWRSLREELISILGQSLPESRINQVNKEICTLKHQVTQKYVELIRAYEQTNSEIEQRQQELEQLKDEEPERVLQVKKSRLQVQQRISELREQTKIAFKEVYDEMLLHSAVETMIRNRYNNKKEAKEFAASYLVEQLQGKLEFCI